MRFTSSLARCTVSCAVAKEVSFHAIEDEIEAAHSSQYCLNFSGSASTLRTITLAFSIESIFNLSFGMVVIISFMTPLSLRWPSGDIFSSD